jgi:hypothetical protein
MGHVYTGTPPLRPVGWLVGWFLLVLLWLMFYLSHIPSSHSLAEPHARKRNRSLCSLQLAAPAFLTSWRQREAYNVSDRNAAPCCPTPITVYSMLISQSRQFLPNTILACNLLQLRAFQLLPARMPHLQILNRSNLL